MDYMTFLNGAHRFLCPRTYLEIGVNAGDTLSLAHCLAIGIDPAPQPSARALVSPTVKLYETTSDQFFHDTDVFAALDGMEIDLAFIDGMHLFEYALSDFINVERHASFFSLVLFHDVFPAEADWEGRQQRVSNWTGDVWKIIPCLKKYRPELSISVLDAPPSGLAIVSGLNPGSSVLSEKFKEIVEEFTNLEFQGVEELRNSFQPTIESHDYFTRFLRHGRGGSTLSSPYRPYLENIHPVASRPIADLLATRPESEIRELDKIGEAASRIRPAMFCYGPEDDPAFAAARACVTAEADEPNAAAHFVELADATVVSHFGIIKLRDNTFLSESLVDLDDTSFMPYYSNNSAMMIEKSLADKKQSFLWTKEDVITIDEPCFLAKKCWYNSYGHWIMEILPKVLWAYKVGYDGKFAIGGRDRIEMHNDNLWPVIYQIFNTLGISEERIIPVDDGDVVKFRRLTYASPLGKNPTSIHPAVIQLCDEFVHANPASFADRESGGLRGFGRRLFLRRRSVARNCLNENELLQIAEKYGFVAFDPAERGFVEQAGAFRGAEVIVGAHGSAWANCVFMHPGSRLLVLNSVIFPDGWFHRLFSVRGLDYGVVFGRPDEKRAVLHSDFVVDPDVFESALKRQICS